MGSACFRSFFIVLMACTVLSLGAELVQAQVNPKTEGKEATLQNSGNENKQDQGAVSDNQASCKPGRDYLYMVITQTILIVLILFVLPLLSYCQNKEGKIDLKSLRGLGLPSGSIRGMLALLIVGSMVNLLLFGHCALEDVKKFDAVLDAFTAISMAVIAFYFANRSSTQPKEK